MALPLVDVSQNVLKWFLAGLEERHRREQMAHERQLSEQKIQLEQENQKRLESQFKENLKLMEQQQKALNAYRDAQIKQDQAARQLKAFELLANNRIKPTPTNQGEIDFLNSFVAPTPEPSFSNKWTPFQGIPELEEISFGPESQKALYESISRGETSERIAREREEGMLRRMEEQNKAYMERLLESLKAKKEIADSTNQTRKEIAENKAAKVGVPDQDGDEFWNDPKTLESIKTGAFPIDDAKSDKSKLRYRQVAQSAGIFPQTRKFVEDSSKLAESAKFIKLASSIIKNPTRTREDIARLLADARALKQQIGTLGAQFPSLGRLSDPDIRILEGGLPGAKEKFFERLFPDIGKVYLDQLEGRLYQSYASRLKGHLAAVPDEKEKVRLIKHYNLFIPGLEKVNAK